MLTTQTPNAAFAYHFSFIMNVDEDSLCYCYYWHGQLTVGSHKSAVDRCEITRLTNAYLLIIKINKRNRPVVKAFKWKTVIDTAFSIRWQTLGYIPINSMDLRIPSLNLYFCLPKRWELSSMIHTNARMRHCRKPFVSIVIFICEINALRGIERIMNETESQYQIRIQTGFKWCSVLTHIKSLFTFFFFASVSLCRKHF